MQGGFDLGGGWNEAPTIIVKKVRAKRRGPQHGSWKVAFADFVTALMALFLVMWMMNSNQQTRAAVASYFDDPVAFAKAPPVRRAVEPATKSQLEALARHIQQSVRDAPDLAALEKQVAISIGSEGMRIELIEDAAGMFFESGSPAPTSEGRRVIGTIGGELAKLSNSLVIEGHTDSKPFGGRANYTNWELSVDRANAARRLLIDAGFPADKVVEVRGFADTSPRNSADPEDPANRRISLIVRFDP